MDGPGESAPLTLLTGDTASGTLVRLRSLLGSDDALVTTHASPPNSSSFEIAYLGVSLRLMVRAQVTDIAGLKKIFCNLDPAAVRSNIDIGLGEHVAGGERVPAIVQVLLAAATRVGSSLGAVATIWHPAQIVSGFDYFSESVEDYLGGGVFPVLAMVNFKAAADGTVNSTGLGFLAGQELQIAGSGADERQIMRRFLQAAHDMATYEQTVPAV